MTKTTEERAERDLSIQKLLGEFITNAPKMRPGWSFISPGLAKKVFLNILKMYPEVKL